jgi:hypothetical protein
MAGDEGFQGVTVHSTFQVVWFVDMNEVALILGAWTSAPNSRGVATQMSHFPAFGVGEKTHRDGGLAMRTVFHDTFGFACDKVMAGVVRLAGRRPAVGWLLPLARHWAA